MACREVDPTGEAATSLSACRLLRVLEFDLGDASSGVEAGAALDADGLQGDLAVAAAHEDVGADAAPTVACAVAPT